MNRVETATESELCAACWYLRTERVEPWCSLYGKNLRVVKADRMAVRCGKCMK